MSEKKTDYVSEGLNRLLSQFDGSVRLRALLGAFLNRVQDFEDAYHPLIAERGLDNATGDRLDIIGQLLQVARGGRDDTSYRTALQIEIAILTSTGTTEEMVTLLEQLVVVLTGPNPTTNYEVIEYYPKALYLRPVDEQIATSTAETIVEGLRRAVAAATQILFVHSAFTDAQTFTLSSLGDTVETDAATGLADDTKTQGGHLSGAP